MPYKDPEKKRAANAARMRKRRAEGTAWIDPAKETARKLIWYHLHGGKEKLIECQRRRREKKEES